VNEQAGERTRGQDLERSARLRTLSDAVHQAEQGRQAHRARWQLQKHKQAVQSLSSQALQTRASLDALKKTEASSRSCASTCGRVQAERRDSTTATTPLRAEFDQLRCPAAAQDSGPLKDVSRRHTRAELDGRDRERRSRRSSAAGQLRMSQTTGRMASLNSLAEHVSAEDQALEASTPSSTPSSNQPARTR
jgi:hypothetical protein